MKQYNNYFGNTKDNKKMNDTPVKVELDKKENQCEDCDDCTCDSSIKKTDNEAIVDNCAALNLREYPTMDSKILRVLNKGQTLKLIKVLKEDWIEVDLPGEYLKGFVKQQFTKK